MQTLLKSCTKSTDTPTCRHLTGSICFSCWSCDMSEISRHTDVPLFHECAHISSAIKTSTKYTNIPTLQYPDVATWLKSADIPMSRYFINADACIVQLRYVRNQPTSRPAATWLFPVASCVWYADIYSAVKTRRKIADTPTYRYFIIMQCNCSDQRSYGM